MPRIEEDDSRLVTVAIDWGSLEKQRVVEHVLLEGLPQSTIVDDGRWTFLRKAT